MGSLIKQTKQNEQFVTETVRARLREEREKQKARSKGLSPQEISSYISSADTKQGRSVCISIFTFDFEKRVRGDTRQDETV